MLKLLAVQHFIVTFIHVITSVTLLVVAQSFFISYSSSFFSDFLLFSLAIFKFVAVLVNIVLHVFHVCQQYWKLLTVCWLSSKLLAVSVCRFCCFVVGCSHCFNQQFFPYFCLLFSLFSRLLFSSLLSFSCVLVLVNCR